MTTLLYRIVDCNGEMTSKHVRNLIETGSKAIMNNKKIIIY